MEKEENLLVSIIILNYNAGDLLIECIESILKTKYQNYEIILIDNASTDGSHKKCKTKFPTINLIENSKNLGYCEGNNIGIKNANGDYVVILNPDTVVDQNWLDELINSYQKYGEGLYQPKFLTTTDHKTIMSTGNMIQLFGFGYARAKGEIDSKQFEEHEMIGFASGTCLFTHIDVIKKIGMLDSFLFAYLDDLELGWRALLMGIRSHYVPKSIVYHPSEGYSFKWSKFKFYLLERNRIYCILTHYSRITLIKIIPFLILTEFGIILFYLKKRMLSQKINGYIDIIKNRKLIDKKYKEIQSLRSISDREIIKNFNDSIQVPEKVFGKKSNQLFVKYMEYLTRAARRVV